MQYAGHATKFPGHAPSIFKNVRGQREQSVWQRGQLRGAPAAPAAATHLSAAVNVGTSVQNVMLSGQTVVFELLSCCKAFSLCLVNKMTE